MKRLIRASLILKWLQNGKKYVTKYGMSQELGTIAYGENEKKFF